MGYVEFDDFIPYTVYKKKVAIAFGNCHMGAIQRCMEYSEEFACDYGFYLLPPIQSLTADFHLQDIMGHCDLLLHQAVRPENALGGKYLSEQIIKYTDSSRCKILVLPNLYGLPKCFFPQLRTRSESKGFHRKYICYDDINIKKAFQQKMSIDCVEQLLSQEIYSDAIIMEMWSEFQTKLKTREIEWDIKISDYIYSHYQKEKLFTDSWHISSVLVKEIADRTLINLGYGSSTKEIVLSLDNMEVFIYEDVKRALKLEFQENIIRQYSENVTSIEKGGLSQRGYIEMCFNIYSLEEKMLD